MSRNLINPRGLQPYRETILISIEITLYGSLLNKGLLIFPTLRLQNEVSIFEYQNGETAHETIRNTFRQRCEIACLGLHKRNDSSQLCWLLALLDDSLTLRRKIEVIMDMLALFSFLLLVASLHLESIHTSI